MPVRNAGASALATAIGQGAMLRLKDLSLTNASIGDDGMVALAPAVRRLPALESLSVAGNAFSDDGLAALVAPSLPAGAPPPLPTGPLATLKSLDLSDTDITDFGCDKLNDALNDGVLPALDRLDLDGTNSSEAAQDRVQERLNR